MAAITQFTGWVILLKSVFYDLCLNKNTSKIMRYLTYFVLIAGTIKFILQLGSTIPFISTLAFGFRPIVIAYLHLVLLAFISGAILLYLFSTKLISNTKWSTNAVISFTIGIFLNELVLAVQGVASFSYTAIPFVNIVLFFIAVILLTAAFGMFVTNLKQTNKN